jgi:hypothetical protein
MLRSKQLITTAAVLAVCAAPASAVPYEELRPSGTKDAAPVAQAQDLRSPDARDAAEHRGIYAAKPDRGPYVLNRDYGSPDAVDAARDLPPVQIPAPVVEVRAPSGGFDWGDAGIGAAGMIALFSIAAGSALLLTTRRRQGSQTLAH